VPAQAARIDNAILADRTDNNCPRGRQVSETRATTPVFPPGRYGRRRDGRRRLAAPIIFGVVVLVVSALFTFRLYDQYGDPDYDAQIIGWTVTSDTQIKIDFRVRVPQGHAAECLLRARTYAGAEVGHRTVTVRPPGGEITTDASETVPTTERASVGDVIRCRPAG
jgi:hypothetical protein